MTGFYARLRSIRHEHQRIPGQVGDWLPVGDMFEVCVSATGDWRYDALIAVHELVEAILCRERGITAEQVDEFDRAHPDPAPEDEQGDMAEAPYRRQHCFATGIERLLAAELGVDWAAYADAVEKLEGSQ